MIDGGGVSPGRRRVFVGLVVLGGVGLVGTAWFWLVEHFSLVDALYQSVTTITTVGFGEARPFSTSARLFSVALMVVGVAAAFYTLGGVFEDLVESRWPRFERRRMERRIAALSGHTVLCGYGRVGTRIARLLARGAPIVVVDVDPRALEKAAESGLLVVEGDSTEDSVLDTAGVARASTLIVCLASDADAISAVLSARDLNPDLRIVARANAESSEGKLARAGVDHVVNLLNQGAQRMAAFADQPAVADFLDVVVHDGSLEYRLEELRIPSGSAVSSRTLGEAHLRARTGALVLALREPDGTFRSNPGPDMVLTEGATLIVIGTADQLAGLERFLGDRSAPQGNGGGRPGPHR